MLTALFSKTKDIGLDQSEKQIFIDEDSKSLSSTSDFDSAQFDQVTSFNDNNMKNHNVEC
jgi:hypothetical protein